MIEREVTVVSDAGVHARPAMMIVKEAMKYPCQVTIVKDEIEANGKSIMSVIGLAILAGTTLTIRADGEGEVEIVNYIVNLIESDFK